MINISAIIVVKNHPPHLWETIQSIESFASEIIIGNINASSVILNKLKNNKKVVIFDLPANIPYADLVREDLKNKARNQYILYLDPDEVFPKKTIKLIEQKINNFDYFYFPRKNIIFGRWIKNSRWWPDYQLRFFKKEAVIWPKVIHPEPQGKGRGFTFSAEPQFAIFHYNYDKLDYYFEKAHRYAKAEAALYIQNREELTLQQTIKKSINEFISRFFAEEGYKDGAHGFFLAILQMFYYFLVHLYYWEAKKYQNIDRENLIRAATQFFKFGTTETSYWLIDKKLINYSQRLKFKILNKVIKILRI